jgi:hypothetical protein
MTQEKQEGKAAEPTTIPGKPIPTKTVVITSACIVDGKQVEPGAELTLPENEASLLIGDGLAQTPEDAAKAKEASAATTKAAAPAESAHTDTKHENKKHGT